MTGAAAMLFQRPQQIATKNPGGFGENTFDRTISKEGRPGVFLGGCFLGC